MSAAAGERLSLLRLSGPQRLLEAGALLNSIALFSAIPFAALYLNEHTPLSTPAIGAVVGGISFTAAFGGVVGGLLVDRFGATRVMRIGLTLYVVVYTSLAVVREPSVIVTLLLMLGLARLMVEPGAKKLLSHAAGEDGRAFRLRYMTLCLGAILGPAIGGVLYHITPVAFFAVPAVFFVAYLTLVLVRGRMLSALERDGVSTPSTRQTLGKPLRDRRLLAVVGAGIVIFFVFSQLESMIPLYLKSHYGDRTEAYYSAAFIMCAVLALALQVPLYRVITKLRHNHVVVLGAMMFAVSFLCFWASSGNLALLYVGIVFWTVGEGVLLPMPDMAVHELADNTHKGAYFGLSEIRYLGFFAGPFAGGFLLAGSEALYFAAMGAFIFLCVPPLLRRSSDREPLPEASPEPSHTS